MKSVVIVKKEKIFAGHFTEYHGKIDVYKSV
jgi:hypothetical protein